MKETNDAILVDMEMLKKESLEDKNCIEELREHISGLKLNSKPNEVRIQTSLKTFIDKELFCNSVYMLYLYLVVDYISDYSSGNVNFA